MCWFPPTPSGPGVSWQMVFCCPGSPPMDHHRDARKILQEPGGLGRDDHQSGGPGGAGRATQSGLLTLGGAVPTWVSWTARRRTRQGAGSTHGPTQVGARENPRRHSSTKSWVLYKVLFITCNITQESNNIKFHLHCVIMVIYI